MLSLLEWPRLARLVRGQCLSLRERDFMLATRVLGLSARRRLFGHLLPNTIPILVVMATMAVANAILSESALSYLGLGVVPPTPSWGNMMDAANSLIDFQRRPAVDAAGHRHLYHRDRHQRAGRWPARCHGSQYETEAEMTTPLVSFNHLSVSFAGERSRVRAVQEVSFTIQAGQTVGVVGESGCGKSVTAMALMGLLPPQTARIDGGEIASRTAICCG